MDLQRMNQASAPGAPPVRQLPKHTRIRHGESKWSRTSWCRTSQPGVCIADDLGAKSAFAPMSYFLL